MFHIDPLVAGEEQFAPGEHPHTGPSAQRQVRGLQHQLLTPRPIRPVDLNSRFQGPGQHQNCAGYLRSDLRAEASKYL
jgi:hypothetical protein